MPRGSDAWCALLIVPSLDFLAAGALRHGTGESHSIYASIVLLPVLWFAAREGRRNVGYAAAGATVAIMVPFALGSSIDANPNELFPASTARLSLCSVLLWSTSWRGGHGAD
jgi:hypothetical protein